jgi:DNA-binding transcriptional LysR family regulator
MNLSETARRLRGGQSETLNLGLVSGAAQIFVPRLFRSLASTIQDVQLRLITAPTRAIFNDLQEERIDAGIAIESDPDRVPAGLVFDRLLTIEMVLIAHPDELAPFQVIKLHSIPPARAGLQDTRRVPHVDRAARVVDSR